MPPGPVHAILDLPNELASVSDIRSQRATAMPMRPTARRGCRSSTKISMARASVARHRDGAELADRFLLTSRTPARCRARSGSRSTSARRAAPRRAGVAEAARAARRESCGRSSSCGPARSSAPATRSITISRAALVLGLALRGSGGYRLDFDFAAEVAEASDEAADGLGLVATVEVVAPRSRYSMPSRSMWYAAGEHRGGDGDDGLLGAAARLDAEELSAQVAAP